MCRSDSAIPETVLLARANQLPDWPVTSLHLLCSRSAQSAWRHFVFSLSRGFGLVLSRNVEHLADVREDRTAGFFGILGIASPETYQGNKLLALVLPMRSMNHLPFIHHIAWNENSVLLGHTSDLSWHQNSELMLISMLRSGSACA